MYNFIIKLVSLILLFVALYATISVLVKDMTIREYVSNFIHSKKVEKYRSTVTQYAKENGIEEYVDVLLAMMMQESKGRGNDPMQSSESLCGEIGCIKDPEQSIEQGVSYFAKALNLAEGDVKLAVQSYNFGLGFTRYVKEKAEHYSEEVAIAFSREMYEKAEDKSLYTCLRKEAKQYDACYGDIYYVRDVMAYKERFAQ